MFTGILDCSNFSFDSTIAKTTRNQDTAHIREQFIHILRSYGLGVDPFNIDNGMIVDTAMFQCLYNRNVSVVKLNVFSNQCNRNFRRRVAKLIHHLGPVGQIRFRARQMKTFAGYLGKMFLFHGKGCFIEIFYVQVLQHMVFRYITEQSNLILDSLFQWKLCTAYNDVRLNSHSLQLFDRSLGWFRFHFTGCFQIRNQSYMEKDGIVMSYFMLELTNCLQKWLALNIADSSANFNDGNVCILGSKIPIETALDFIGDMRDNLYSPSAIVTAAFLLKNGPVYFSGCYIGVFIQAFINKTLIVSQVKVGLCTIIGNKNFSVLYRVHSTGVDIDVRIEFLHGYFVSTRFQKTPQGCSGNSFTKS